GRRRSNRRAPARGRSRIVRAGPCRLPGTTGTSFLFEPAENLTSISSPAVLALIEVHELLQVGTCEIGLAEDVLGHPGMVEGHVIVGLVVDDEAHDRPG